ncbi:MAG: transposase [Anaerolineales bacterium]
MPYEYRKLSPKEQIQIVEERRQRGFPLHQPPHPFRETGCYLITAANFEHQAIMVSPERRSSFQEILLKGFQEINAEIIGWVILTNHYHILVNIESLDSVSSLLKQIHGSTSYAWNKEDSLSGKRKVWYRYADRMIRNERHLNQTLNYIHYNPIKHGSVEDVYDWPWSSLFLYLDDKGQEWLRDQREKDKPTADFGKGWDE